MVLHKFGSTPKLEHSTAVFLDDVSLLNISDDFGSTIVDMLQQLSSGFMNPSSV
jgi:hypothetical protein